MKHLKTYESYYKDTNANLRFSYDMDDIRYEKLTSVIPFLKKEFNFIDDIFKKVTGNGIDNPVIESSTGNQYSLGNVKRIAEDLIDNGDGGQWYIEHLYLSNSTIDNGYEFSIGIENIGEVKGPTFNEEEGWSGMNIELTYMIYVEDPENDRSFKFPKLIKTHKIKKEELEESFKKAYDLVKESSDLPLGMRYRM